MAAHHSISPYQLSMFMTAGEIQSQYQVLDADREETTSDRYYEPTNSPISTHGNPNTPIPTAVREGKGTDEIPTGWAWAQRQHGSDMQRHTHLHGDDYRTESDADVWSRKLEESKLSPPEYREVHGGNEGNTGPDYEPEWAKLGPYPEHPRWEEGTDAHDDYHDAVASWEGHQNSAIERVDAAWDAKHGEGAPSLYDKIASTEGGITHPVHLGTGGNVGSEGKPMVYGGHHRIAAMAHLNPDQLIPVLHHEDFWSARMGEDDGGFKYT